MDSLPCAPRSPGTLRRSVPVLQEPPGLPAFLPTGLQAYRPPGLPAYRPHGPFAGKVRKRRAYRRSPERNGVNHRNGAFVAAKRAVIGCEVRRVGAEPGILQNGEPEKGTNALFGVGYSHKSLGRGLNLRYQTIPCFTVSRDSCWSNPSSFSS
jgi:hypothetical protein